MKANLWRAAAPLLAVALALLPPGGATPPASARRQGQCPVVRISCPTSDVEAGTEPTFTADVSGGDPNVTPTYNWVVSAGTITSGQGTPTIRVETVGLGGQRIMAAVAVGGYRRECRAESSCTVSVAARKAEAPKGVAYVVIDSGEEKARLDRYAAALRQEPGAQAYVITYGGRTSGPDVARKAGERVRDHLLKACPIECVRVVTVDGGYREEPTTELWIVPAGATPPQPTPTVAARGAKRATARPRARTRPAPRRRRKT